MTQTPASGPFELVTTPPMSSLSIATAAPPPPCRAPTPTSEPASTARQNPRNKIFFVIRSPRLADLNQDDRDRRRTTHVRNPRSAPWYLDPRLLGRPPHP